MPRETRVPSPTPLTADDLFRCQPPDADTELIRGRMIVREPPRPAHGRVAANLCCIVLTFVRAHRLGAVYAQDTGFQITHDPDTVLAPDLAFVHRDRLPAAPDDAYGQIPPDLVAEILSPSDRSQQARRKVALWLRAGVRLVWMIEPQRRVATMFFADGAVVPVSADGALDGGEVVPGFTCSLADVFEG